jgi:uncharacterized repeat protein (TIGR01451 family)
MKDRAAPLGAERLKIREDGIMANRSILGKVLSVLLLVSVTAGLTRQVGSIEALEPVRAQQLDRPAAPIREMLMAPATQTSQELEFVGQIGGSVRAVAINGQYAYLAEGAGIVVLDISNPHNPVKLGKTHLPNGDLVWGLAVSGHYLSVAAGENGLHIINIANPAAPVLTGHYDTAGYARDVAVAGSYAYVADGSAGLRVINIANPAAPVENGFYNTPGNANGVALDSSYAYVADGSAGLRVISIANPATPVETGFYNTPGSGTDVTVAGSYAYVADGSAGLRVINIANPAAPDETGYYDPLSVIIDVAVVGSYAYVADGLYVINIANPAAPVITGFYDTPGSGIGVSVVGNYAYVAAGSAGLRVINIANPAAPILTGFYDTLGSADGVAVAGSYAFVADDSAGGLRVINVANPAAPVLTGFYDTPGYANDVAVAGSYAFIANGSAGLRVINIANPAAPVLTGFYDTPLHASGVAVVGGYAYVADGASLIIVNIANPAAPVLTGHYDTSGYAYRVAVVGNYAYVAAGSAGLRVINIANPAAPFETGYYDTLGNATDVAMAGSYAYVADDAAGLRVINIANPDSPIETGYYNTPGRAYGVAVAKSYAYIADNDEGLIILRHGAAPAGGSVPPAILDAADLMVGVADELLSLSADDTLAVIDEIVYFRAAVPAQAVKLTFAIIKGAVDVIGGLGSFSAGELPLRLASPGVTEYLKSPEFAMPFACKLSNAFMKDVSGLAPSEYDGAKRLARLALRTGINSIVVYYQDSSCLKDFAQDLTLDSLFLASIVEEHLGKPLAQAPVGRKIDDSQVYMQAHLDALTGATIAPLSSSVIDGYVDDLRKRTEANRAVQDQLDDARMTLEAVHAANEYPGQGGAVAQLVLRTPAKFFAEWFFDGIGRAAVQGSLALFDSYMASNALDESQQMLVLAQGTLLNTAPAVVQRITDNTNAGILRILAGRPPNPPQGAITGVEHFSSGRGLFGDSFWQEQDSYSRITMRNTGDSPADFYISGRYLAETTRLTLPWATLWLAASSDPIRLNPGQSASVKIEYKTGNIGYSPREVRTIGNVPASDILLNLMAVDEAGLFKLDFDSSEWAPQRAQTTQPGTLQLANLTDSDDWAVIDDPIGSSVTGGLGRDYQTGHIWVNNPFDVTTPIVVTQPLLSNATVLDPGGATLDGSDLVWTGSVEPQATGYFSYTMRLDSPPGTDVTIPAPSLQLEDPSGISYEIDGDSQLLTLPWPLDITRTIPDWVPPYTGDTITVQATNFSDTAASGNFTVEVLSNAGAVLTTESLALSIPAGEAQSLSFNWPSSLDIGAYQVRGTLQTGGNQEEIFTDPIAIGAPPPLLNLSASPIADNGTVALGSTLDYTLAIENVGEMALTDVAAGFTLPSDVQIVSMSDGGTQVGSDVQWQLSGLAIGETRTVTAQILVPTTFVGPNQGRYLESTPYLTSSESPDAFGSLLTLLVLGPAAPEIAGFTPTSGTAGTTVTINGTNLTGVTDVAFNGTLAVFTPISTSQITATVPDGATTGPIEVTTPGGTVNSTGNFIVITNQPPNTPASPDPADGDTDLPLDTFLSWSATDPDNDRLTFEVRFGESDPPPQVIASQSATSYDPPGELAYDTTYYWQIVADDGNGGLTPSPVWSFTAAPHFYTVSGQVTDTEGAPIEGVTIYAYHINTGNETVTSTDENGDYTFLLDPGNYELYADLADYIFVPDYFELSVPPSTTGIDFIGEFDGTYDIWLTPTDDAYVDQANKTRNYGSTTTLRVKNASSDLNSYLKFQVDGLFCTSIDYATLWVWGTDAGPDGGSVYAVVNNWTEATIKWNNAPAISGTPLSSFGAAFVDQWHTADVTNAIAGDGTYSLAIRNNSTNSVYYSSKEGAATPWLNIGYTPLPAQAPDADYRADGTAGLAPLTVTFENLTTGCPREVLWNFGDGTTSTEWNPTHTYDTPGNYKVTLWASNEHGTSIIEPLEPNIIVEEPPPAEYFYISPSGSGAVAGLAFAPADILKYNATANTWEMFFDGSDVKATKNVAAFAFLDNGDLLLSYAASQAITGVGTFAAQDVARFTPTQLGDTTAGTFQVYFDGSDVGLSTFGEKIDALGILDDGRILISTTGAAAVPGPGGTTLKAQDEDVLVFTPTTLGTTTAGSWAPYFDGTAVTGLGVEDINAFWEDPATGDIYITIVGSFNLGGIKGNGRDIVRLAPSGGGYVPAELVWDGSAMGFPTNVDALEIVK